MKGVLLAFKVSVYTAVIKVSIYIDWKMGRLSYICTECSEHFTRKYSAKRHNYNLHNSEAVIVRLPDYLVGRTSGQYMASHPFWYRRTDKRIPGIFRPATVSDTMGDTFQIRDSAQQAPLRISQYSNNPLYRPMDNQRHGSGLSQDTIVKIGELKRLVNKHPQYLDNPDEIVKWAIYCSSNGDDTFLDNKLEQLRALTV